MVMLPRNQDSGRRPRTAPGSTDKQDAAAHRLRLRLAARSFKRTKALFTAGPDLELLGPKFGREAVMIGDEITLQFLSALGVARSSESSGRSVTSNEQVPDSLAAGHSASRHAPEKMRLPR